MCEILLYNQQLVVITQELYSVQVAYHKRKNCCEMGLLEVHAIPQMLQALDYLCRGVGGDISTEYALRCL